jgi:RNA polymerase sigma-70 factor (ECF subfamily)
VDGIECADGNGIWTMAPARTAQNHLYREVAVELGPALERLARAYEADPDLRRDLLQEIHLALWRSLAGYDGRCSRRTWAYRVAHNVGATHVARQQRVRRLVVYGLDDLERLPDSADLERAANDRETSDRLADLIGQLALLDRQVILSYLEGVDAAGIAEITGLSSGNVATKVHRIKRVLARRFREGGAS